MARTKIVFYKPSSKKHGWKNECVKENKLDCRLKYGKLKLRFFIKFQPIFQNVMAKQYSNQKKKNEITIISKFQLIKWCDILIKVNKSVNIA